jgi:hypothetical protein
MSLLMAQSGHHDRAEPCPLSGGKADVAATPAKPERRPVHPLRHQKHLRGTSPVTEFWQGAREVKVSWLKRHSLAFGSLAPDAGVSGDGERPGPFADRRGWGPATDRNSYSQLKSLHRG